MSFRQDASMKRNKQAVLDRDNICLYNLLQANDKAVPLTGTKLVLSTTQADHNMTPSPS